MTNNRSKTYVIERRFADGDAAKFQQQADKLARIA